MGDGGLCYTKLNTVFLPAIDTVSLTKFLVIILEGREEGRKEGRGEGRKEEGQAGRKGDREERREGRRKKGRESKAKEETGEKWRNVRWKR